jgi:hypothetical protein
MTRLAPLPTPSHAPGQRPLPYPAMPPPPSGATGQACPRSDRRPDTPLPRRHNLHSATDGGADLPARAGNRPAWPPPPGHTRLVPPCRTSRQTRLAGNRRNAAPPRSWGGCPECCPRSRPARTGPAARHRPTPPLPQPPQLLHPAPPRFTLAGRAPRCPNRASGKEALSKSPTATIQACRSHRGMPASNAPRPRRRTRFARAEHDGVYSQAPRGQSIRRESARGGDAQ